MRHMQEGGLTVMSLSCSRTLSTSLSKRSTKLHSNSTSHSTHGRLKESKVRCRDEGKHSTGDHLTCAQA